MLRRPPRLTRPDTLLPSTTLFRSRTAAPDPRPPARRDPAVRRIPGRRRPTCDHGGMTSPTRFPDLPLSPALTPGLEALGYAELTPIQAQALPAVLERRDVIAQAPTGSGKTAAFGLGVLQANDEDRKSTRLNSSHYCASSMRTSA